MDEMQQEFLVGGAAQRMVDSNKFITGNMINPMNHHHHRVGLAETTTPKSGRVTEMCKQWLVHEDSALAYQLQSQEIDQHLSHNKHRNAQIREDTPHAIDEQQREQQLAEQAAAVYHRMLQEQEAIDKHMAHQLADSIEREEKQKRRAIERHDEDLVRKLLDKDRCRAGSSKLIAQKPPMPLPDDLYTEPYTPPDELADDFERIDIQAKKRQEAKDEAMARQLQEELRNSEESILDRDRMLAIEAQDKELAKLLQERERSKAKRAKERARQKAMAKKQQMDKEQMHLQLMPDDSYSNPIDVLPMGNASRPTLPPKPGHEDTNYSYPVDLIPPQQTLTQSTLRSYDASLHVEDMMNMDNNQVPPPPVRPTQLDLRSPLTHKINKPRYADPVDDAPQPVNQADAMQQFGTPSKGSNIQNIAMAIDPTYPRRSKHHHSPPLSYDTTTSSSTVTTSTSNNSSSSSPGMLLPTPDVVDDDPSPVPPYMPIQGQRRTASLEKKSKKRAKDGCKQQ